MVGLAPAKGDVPGLPPWAPFPGPDLLPGRSSTWRPTDGFACSSPASLLSSCQRHSSGSWPRIFHHRLRGVGLASGLWKNVVHSTRRFGPKAIRNTTLAFPGTDRRASISHSRGLSIPGISPSRMRSHAARFSQKETAVTYTRTRSHLRSRYSNPK